MCSTTPPTGEWDNGDWSDSWTAWNCSDEEGQKEGSGGSEVKYTPDLTAVYSSLRWAFILHAYGFACLFFFLAFYSFFSILNLRSQLSTRPYMTTINSFLCLLGASRAAVLFIDPYGLKHTLPVLIGSLLWDLGFPSLISSFSLIQIAFVQLTQEDAEVEESSFAKKTCLSVLITIHFMNAIISAIYANINPHLMLAKLITELVFAIWGFILCGSFAYAGKRVLDLLGRNDSSTSASTHNEKGIANLFGMAPGQNLASSLTAALAPTLLQSMPKDTSSSGTPSAADRSKEIPGKDTPKIKIIDENERIISVPSTDGSRLPDIREVGSKREGDVLGSIGGVGAGRWTKVGTGGPCEYVRPPSPVLPRRKSSGPGLRAGSFTPRRLSRGDETAEKEIQKKSLTWCELDPDKPSSSDRRPSSRKSSEVNPLDSTDRGGMESLTGTTGGGGPDYTLQSILSHIAYVNQTALDYRLSRKLSRKNQVQKVMKYTSITAILGFVLCIGEVIRIVGPYGVLASSLPQGPVGVWPWFILQTLCRITEFGMGATIANIAKQPSNRPHHYAYSIQHKHHRESLYL